MTAKMTAQIGGIKMYQIPVCITCERIHHPSSPCPRKVAKALLHPTQENIDTLSTEESELVKRLASDTELVEEAVIEWIDFLVVQSNVSPEESL